MLIRTHASGFNHPTSSDITPESLYWRRRDWLHKLAVAGAGAAVGAWAARDAQASATRPGKLAPLSAIASDVSGATVPDSLTPYADVTTYNNFYELGTEKSDPSRLASRFKSSPWRLQVDGLVHKPLVLDGADLLKVAPLEERIYRLRCVEGWSMVIPWVGYSLSRLIARAEPMGSAKFVEFITAADPQSMPGLNRGVLNWPYKEGLRMDEALHPLTLLAVGLYGEVLPNQNGAPIRLVVPWKYGFKSGKSLVRIRLVDKQPVSSWEEAAPQEYGFYSNVNPQVAHPRWSQATERRIGEDGLLAKRRKTLMFNGYEAQVGSLYTGMDLRRFF